MGGQQGNLSENRTCHFLLLPVLFFFVREATAGLHVGVRQKREKDLHNHD